MPPDDRLTIAFAHAAYRMGERFAARRTGIGWFEVRTRAELDARMPEADVLVVSMLWDNALVARAPRLRFIQSISAGVDQYDPTALKGAGIRLASAAGANANAVAEHAMALMLALARRLPEARDNQARRHWRGMIGDPAAREYELAGKTVVLVGLGRIGGRIARLAKAFDMRVIAVRRDPASGAGPADAVHGLSALPSLLGTADYLVLACPLTPETERLVDAQALARLAPTAALVNVARGRCVDEPALVAALAEGRLAAAALDCAAAEPLDPASPLWGMANVLITPHTAGETSAYEDNVIDILLENLARLRRGETDLRNQIV
ncbi:MAG: D-2-hydroxyacid dehydrogenase [Acetobacteraceae bacterium]